jgi:hypothetical protein
MPTHVNDQITDSVTQVNAKVLRDNPAVDIANFDDDSVILKEQVLNNAEHKGSAEQKVL